MTFLRIVIRSSFLLEHDLFRKPESTFRDHALEGMNSRVNEIIDDIAARMTRAIRNPPRLKFDRLPSPLSAVPADICVLTQAPAPLSILSAISLKSAASSMSAATVHNSSASTARAKHSWACCRYSLEVGMDASNCSRVAIPMFR
jgi:hypothetical protein